MTLAGAPTSFAIDMMPMCARPSRAANVNSMIGLILYRRLIRRVRVRSERCQQETASGLRRHLRLAATRCNNFNENRLFW
jgi:hypothetical protein